MIWELSMMKNIFELKDESVKRDESICPIKTIPKVDFSITIKGCIFSFLGLLIIFGQRFSSSYFSQLKVHSVQVEKSPPEHFHFGSMVKQSKAHP